MNDTALPQPLWINNVRTRVSQYFFDFILGPEARLPQCRVLGRYAVYSPDA
jgi:hypothetical protein